MKHLYPYSKIIKIVNIIKQYSQLSDNIYTVGSVGRKEEYVSDIDFVITIKPYKFIAQINLIFELDIAVPNKDAKIYKFVLMDTIKVDLFYTKKKYLAYAIIHYIGPKEHIIALSKLAHQKGYQLRLTGLHRLK